MTNLAQLDYPDDQLFLIAESDIEKTKRIGACAKEPETLAWLCDIPADGVLWDVGANVGSYTLIALSRGLQVVAFEASAPNEERLRQNLLLNGMRCQVIPFPVWSEQTQVWFDYSSTEPGAALHGVREPEWYGKDQGVPHARHDLPFTAKTWDGRYSELRDAFPLDHYLPLGQPTHLKIDVDGGELKVLQGASETLRGVDGVLIEDDATQGTTEALSALLGAAGLRLESSHQHGDGPTPRC